MGGCVDGRQSGCGAPARARACEPLACVRVVARARVQRVERRVLCTRAATACTFSHTGALGQKVVALSRAFSVAVCPIPCAILLAS